MTSYHVSLTRESATDSPWLCREQLIFKLQGATLSGFINHSRHTWWFLGRDKKQVHESLFKFAVSFLRQLELYSARHLEHRFVHLFALSFRDRSRLQLTPGFLSQRRKRCQCLLDKDWREDWFVFVPAALYALQFAWN
jgi:hypothetical protein